jgi:MerR HTH family regulatory protein
MAQAMEDALAVSDKRAAKLAGVSMRQLRYWEQIGLVVPSVKEQISPRNTVRLYTFQDLLELLVAAELRIPEGQAAPRWSSAALPACPPVGEGDRIVKAGGTFGAGRFWATAAAVLPGLRQGSGPCTRR